MAAKFPLLALTGLALLSLSACAYRVVDPETLKDTGDYWERSDVSEATYMEGPKANQLLHRDISRCVTELRELTRLGVLRQATPGNTAFDSDVPDVSTPKGKLSQWDTPERHGYLLAEHSNYDDFETCMQAKGWERVEHLPYDIAKKSRSDYIEAITGESYQSKYGDRDPEATTPTDPNYGHLNQ